MLGIIIIPIIIGGLIIWDIYWCSKLFEPTPHIAYPITLSTIPDPIF